MSEKVKSTNKSCANRQVDVTPECSKTSPEDIAGMNLAVAVVTTRGGMTSHAAVVESFFKPRLESKIDEHFCSSVAKARRFYCTCL